MELKQALEIAIQHLDKLMAETPSKELADCINRLQEELEEIEEMPRIAPVKVWDKRIPGSQVATELQGSDQSLVEAYKFEEEL